MAEQQFKRNTAYKFRIGDILIGKPVMNSVSGTERFGFLELGDKKIVRVNVIGNIVDKYESLGETKYVSFTVDDGSGQIRLKAFGDETEKFKNFVQGQTVVVIGVVRYWNSELYISPEIIKEMNPKYLLIRKLETEKEKAVSGSSMEKEQITAIKDRILDMIKDAEEEGGVETEKLIMKLQEFSPAIINKEIQKLLEEGIVFEPRPGKIRYLG
ncbi:MAG: OB-fold nucleic acid binding domain-containing protein [Candidatus Pacearchaeota archaeon]|nr:OB-fold nucleic acid binding domain-containing protein [Candidatus Pacearchaeota archaeon]